jgi:hypothetical protein
MRLSLALAALSACSVAHASYFSEGWKPGQAIPTGTAARGAPAANPTSFSLSDLLKPQAKADAPPRKSLFQLASDLQEMAQEAVLAPLRSGPLANWITSSTGLNVSQAIARAKAAASDDKWDKRIQLITDDNWEEIVEYEQLTPAEEDSRVWLILVYVRAPEVFWDWC